MAGYAWRYDCRDGVYISRGVRVLHTTFADCAPGQVYPQMTANFVASTVLPALNSSDMGTFNSSARVTLAESSFAAFTTPTAAFWKQNIITAVRS